MAITDITQKILEEARKKADEIRAEAQQAAKEYEDLKTKEFKEQEAALVEKEKLTKEDIERKMKSMVSMEERNKVLKAKQDLIQDIFAQAIDQLCAADDKDYQRVIEELAKHSDLGNFESGSIISAKGKKSITEKVISSVNSKLQVSEEGDFKGGFIFQSDNIQIDNTFSGVMERNVKPAIENEVAQILFK